VPFKRDSVAVILDRVYANYASLFKPLEKTPRHSLLKVFAAVDAGILHQNLGDLDFLALQLFPDTAEGDYLRQHWASRVTPLYAIAASGEALLTGIPNKPVPAGLVFASASGEQYYTEKAYRIGSDGTVLITLKSQGTGLNTNLAPGEELSIVSSIPAGIDSKAVVAGEGIIGGANAETDEEYLARVLLWLRNPVRYGKTGHFAAWARDANPEVSNAWEYKNFGVFGALMIQVISGSQLNGIFPVDNIAEVTSYINEAAPPVIFTVRTPQIINLDPVVSLLPLEDTQENRETAVSRMKAFLQLVAMPGVQVTAGALRSAIIDGVAITGAAVKLNGDTAGIIGTTILQYPYIGEVSWE
jgi:uncharacterized phage protein gp47/JayE